MGDIIVSLTTNGSMRALRAASKDSMRKLKKFDCCCNTISHLELAKKPIVSKNRCFVLLYLFLHFTHHCICDAPFARLQNSQQHPTYLIFR